VVATLGPVANVTVLERAADGSTSTARQGLHVYLSPPAPANDELGFTFTHFTIGANGALQDAQQNPVSLARSTNHWCYWASNALNDAEVNSKKDSTGDHRFTPVSNAFDLPPFPPSGDPPQATPRSGYALPTEWSGNQLVLPGTKKLTVNVFDCFTRTDQGLTQRRLDQAVSYWKSLLIDVTVNRAGAPSVSGKEATPWSIVLGKTPKGNAKVTLLGSDATTPLNFNFKKDPFQPKSDPSRTITMVVLDDFTVGKAKAFAMMTNPVTKIPFDLNQNFKNPSKNAIIFFAVFDAKPAFAAANVLAHEMGHCLLHDVGLGTDVYSSAQTTQVTDLLTDLGLGLQMSWLIPKSHWTPSMTTSTPDVRASNLMRDDGGTFLVPWQVAVVRAAHELTPRTMSFKTPSKPWIPDP
jgi:hypothetical protein